MIGAGHFGGIADALSDALDTPEWVPGTVTPEGSIRLFDGRLCDGGSVGIVPEARGDAEAAGWTVTGPWAKGGVLVASRRRAP